jgi:hypothetical protein
MKGLLQSLKPPKFLILAVVTASISILLPIGFVYLFFGINPQGNIYFFIWAALVLILFIRWQYPALRNFMPLISIKLAVGLLGAILAGLLMLEYLLLPAAEQSMTVNQLAWVEENGRINDNIFAELSYLYANKNWVWRTDTYQVAKDKGAQRRILVMGDSFVMGDGYSNFNDLWWRQLQRELFYRGYHDVEVIAAGVGGASTQDQFAHLPYIVSQYEPDLIIWGYVPNDADTGIKGDLLDSVVRDDLLNRIHTQAIYIGVLPRVNFQLLELRENKSIGAREYYQGELDLLRGENKERYLQTLKGIANWSKESQIPYFFMTLPNWPDYEHFSERYDLASALFQDANIRFYNTIEAFSEEYEREQPTNVLRWAITPANGHPGPVSTHFFAVQAVDIMEGDYPNILGEKSHLPVQQPLEINQWRPWNLEIEARTSKSIEFIYPASQRSMLRMPYGKPYVQFNFAYPVSLREIQLTGGDLVKASLTYSAEDYDQPFKSIQVVDGGEKAGNELSWSLNEYEFKDKVNTIRVSAEFDGNDRRLSMKFSEGLAQP